MDTTQLRSAAAEHRYLRGLIQVPVGLLFIAAALGNEHWGPLDNDWVFVAVLVLLAGAALAINRFYDEHYGRVTPAAGREAKAIGMGVLGAALLHRGDAAAAPRRHLGRAGRRRPAAGVERRRPEQRRARDVRRGGDGQRRLRPPHDRPHAGPATLRTDG